MISYPLERKKIWVAGETGLVGRALCRLFRSLNYDVLSAPHAVLDLMDQSSTFDWLYQNKPDVVIMAAGKVGGIGANQADQAGFLYNNLTMAQTVIHGAYRAGVEKLLYLGSSCIYPKEAPQPLREESLLTGALEPTNEGYALAKIAGIKLCQFYRQSYGCDFISALPCNLYDPYDRFDPHQSHVIPALILKFHQAMRDQQSSVTLWGTGRPLREFLYCDDLAQAILFVLRHYSDDAPINIGSGNEISISALAAIIKECVGYNGDIIFDSSMPDGLARKILESSKIRAIGWTPDVTFESGLQRTYDWLR